jgi:hypothetical protein
MVTLIRSSGTSAPGDCPTPLAGTCLDITADDAGYTVAGRVRADAEGEARVEIRLPPQLRTGSDLALQAVEPSSKAVSRPFVAKVGVRPTCADDPGEDHDIVSNPQIMLAGESFEAKACPGDADTYGVRLAPGEFVRFDGWFDHQGDGRLQLSLYDVRGELLDTAWDAPGQALLQWRNDSPHDVWVVAHALLARDLGGEDHGVAYQISADKGEALPCFPDLFEPDSRVFEGVHPPFSIPQLRTACDADVDWMNFDVPAGDVLRVDVTHQALDGLLGVRLFDSQGDELARQISNAQGQIRLETMSHESETYRVSVRPLQHGVTTSGLDYQLRAERMTPELCPVDVYGVQPGQQDVQPLPMGQTMQLGVCRDAPLDVFEVALAAGEVLDVTAAFDRADADISMSLVLVVPTSSVSRSQHAVAQSMPAPQGERLAYRAPADGTYFLAVRLRADGDHTTWNGGAYDLSAEVR